MSVRSISLTVVMADGDARRRNVALLGGLILWMVYTRVFWAAYALHATLPPCPFLAITGHPCPLCGGTRSFAYMWRGDLTHAAALYPLGPALFVGTLVAIPVLAVVVLLNRDLRVRLTDPWRGRLMAAGGFVIMLSWLAKLTVLPN